MKRVALAIVAAACDKSGHAPPRDGAPAVAWTVTFEVTHPSYGTGDTITIDASGTVHHTDFGADLGTWQVAPDRTQAIAELALASDLFAPPVDSGMEMGDAPRIDVHVRSAHGDQQKRYDDYETPPSITKLGGALDALVAAHDLDNLAAAGSFAVDIDDVHVDSSGPAPRAVLARIATVLLSPDLAAVKDQPDPPTDDPPPPATTFVIQRGATTRRITSARPPGVLEALERAVTEPAPTGAAWQVSYELELRQDGVDDQMALDATGAMHRNDSGVDCGDWIVPADQLAPIEALVRAPDLFDSTPSSKKSFEGGGYSLKVVTDGVERDHDFSIDDDAPKAAALVAALRPLIAAHDLDNLAAIGAFHVDIVDELRHTTVHLDSTANLLPAALARVATLLRCPALAAAKDDGGKDPPITITLTQGETTRRFVEHSRVRILDALYGAVDDARRSAQ